jgi:hypothetical protein
MLKIPIRHLPFSWVTRPGHCAVFLHTCP